MNKLKQNIVLTEAVYYILLSLYEPMHGYGIMQYVALMSDSRVNMAPGTLYGAITVLLDKGWIKALPVEKESRKKEYVITEVGKIIVKNEIKRLEELIHNGKLIEGGGKI